MNFTVIDIKTGKYPDLWNIALEEDWAEGLMYCDMDGFAIQEDGTLILMDECGKFSYCPEGRFRIVPKEPNKALTLEQLREMVGEPVYDYLGQEWYVIADYYDHELCMTDGTTFEDGEELDRVDERFYRRPPEGEA